MVHSASSKTVVFQPEVYKAWQRGIDKLVYALSPTLGPLPRITAIDVGLNKRPELLDNGAMIARRIIELSDREEDVGAMFLRGVLWKLHQEVGDGTTTAALIFQTIYSEGIKYITAGGNAMLLRTALEKVLFFSLEALEKSSSRINSKEEITQLAKSVSHDDALAAEFGAVFDVIGGYGRLEIEAGRSRETSHQFVDGAYWRSGTLLSEEYTGLINRRRYFENCSIFLSNFSFSDPMSLVPVLEAAKNTRRRVLILVVNDLSDTIKGLLRANNKPGVFEIVAVKTPGTGMDDQVTMLSDLALLTGCRVFLSDTGETVTNITPADLGAVRRIWVDKSQFGIAKGAGDPYQIQERIDQLKRRYQKEPYIAKQLALQHQISNLSGGSAVLWVGGDTEQEIEAKKEIALRISKTVRSGYIFGVQPGGGGAYLRLANLLREWMNGMQDEDLAACRIFIKALEAPMKQMLENVGLEAGPVLARLDKEIPSFEIENGELVMGGSSKVLDSNLVVREVIYRALKSAALALTTDVIVHSPNPERAMTPE